jgi:hypothetical protein
MKHASLIRYPLLSIAMAASLALLHSAGTASAALPSVYNVNTDWSDTDNPNGVWSYNYGNSPIPVHQTFFWGGAGWGIYDFGEASLLKGNPIPTGTPDPFGSTTPAVHDWLPGDVMMHAISIPYGGDTTFINVRWTSPGDGTIDITGRAWDGMIQPYVDRDVAWALLVGGQTIAEHLSTVGVFRGDAAAQFGNNLLPGKSLTGIPVLTGDIVEFRLMTDTYYGQFVGLEENITLVPEIGSAPLFLAGLAAMALVRRLSPRAGRILGSA